ncbi:hypothetical protein L7F22_031289 [Adiantum nelumboides]|nr:hypothetical protein [Adiantum nelumboides]
MSLPINAIDGLRVSPNMRTPSTKFLAAQRGAKLKVPAIWFGEQWPHATYPAKWNSTYFMGAIKSFNRKKFLFSCLFESDLKVYYADWEHIRRYIVKENEDALKFDSCDIVEAFSNNDFDACYDVNDNASLDVVASLDGNDSVLEEFVVSSSRKGRGRPRKCVKRGRPKRVFETSQEDVEKGECREHGLIDETIILDDRPESSNSRKRGRPKKKSNKEPYRGITKPSSSLFEKDVPIDDDDNDSHASFGEGVDCDDATLEAEGGILDDDEDSQNGWHSVSPPHWRSGDAYEVEPKDTFWTLPAFSGERGPDLGHTPRIDGTGSHAYVNLEKSYLGIDGYGTLMAKAFMVFSVLCVLVSFQILYSGSVLCVLVQDWLLVRDSCNWLVSGSGPVSGYWLVCRLVSSFGLWIAALVQQFKFWTDQFLVVDWLAVLDSGSRL